MKRASILLALLLSAAFAWSQCTPQAFSGPGFLLPDTTDALHPVNPLQYYYNEITTYVPTTAIISGFQIPIDSAGYESISGLPQGMTIAVNSPNGYWPAGTNGCFVLMGQPSFSASGDYKVKVSFKIHGLGNSTILHFEYRLTVVDSTIAGLPAVDSHNEPSFFTSPTHLVIRTVRPEQSEVSMHDIQGRLVFKKSLFLEAGDNDLVSLESLPKGLLLVRYSAKGKAITQKILNH